MRWWRRVGDIIKLDWLSKLTLRQLMIMWSGTLWMMLWSEKGFGAGEEVGFEVVSIQQISLL